jgi:hypothetical protein
MFGDSGLRVPGCGEEARSDAFGLQAIRGALLGLELNRARLSLMGFVR